MMFRVPFELRRAIRAGEFAAPTAGECPGYVQTNLVVVPREYAEEFAEFCRLNPKPCPLVCRTEPGSWVPQAAPSADLRTDVGRYRVFRQGKLELRDGRTWEPSDVGSLWRDDFVAFLLGCSFTFETALVAAGLRVRHLDERRNVPMYRTNRPCAAAGRFAGPLVVSMRPYRPEQVPQVCEVTGRYPAMHGEPVHVGNPAALGIANIARPDFGDAVTIADDEVPVFWACGVTPQAALLAAEPEIAITHSPGYMFVTDLRDADFLEA